MGGSSCFSLSGVGKPRGSGGGQYNDQGPSARLPYSSHSTHVSPSRVVHKSITSSSAGASGTIMVGKGLRPGIICPSSSSLLFKTVYCSKAKRNVEADYRPLGPEPTAPCAEVQDGHGREDRQKHLRGAVGLLGGHHRCLYARPNSLGVPPVLRICPGEEGLCFSDDALRALPRPLGLLQGHATHQSLPSQTGRDGLVVPGRFFNPSQIGPHVRRSDWTGSQPIQQVGNQRQRGKICSPSPTEDGIFGGNLGLQDAYFVPSKFQSGGYSGALQKLPGQVISVQEGAGIPCGTPELCGSLSSSGEASSAPYHCLDERPYFSGLTRSSGSSGRGFWDAFRSLDPPRILDTVCAYAPSGPYIGHHDRCISPRLEWFTATTSGRGLLGSRGGWYVYELDGAEGHSSVNPGLCNSSSGTVCQGPFGQYYGLGLPSPSGFLGVKTPSGTVRPNPGALSLLAGLSSPSPYQGCPECPCGQRVKRLCYIHGVVLGSTVFLVDLRPLGSAPGRCFCNEGQFPVAFFRFSVPRPLGRWSGCILSKLGLLVCDIPFSPISGPSGCGSGVEQLQGNRFPGGSLLGVGELVSNAISEMPRENPSPSGACALPDYILRTGVPPKVVRLEAVRLEVIRSSLKSKGYTQASVEFMLQQHRKSSCRQYQTVWGYFMAYLDLKKIRHDEIAVCTVINFLAYMYKTYGRAYRTIATYRCALRHPLLYRFGLEINTPESDAFMKGLYNANPPIRCAPMPVWSLNDLLKYLRLFPFEPLEEAPWRFLTQKTLVLLLLATGRRIGEVANLSLESVVIGDRITLKWLPSFRPKHDTEDFRPDHPSISTLKSAEVSDCLLCPVRAWKAFVKWRSSKMTSFRKDCLWPVLQSSLRGQFKSVVAASRDVAGVTGTTSIGPHQFRKLAASYSMNYLVSSSRDEALLARRMGSSSMTVLRKNYISNVPKLIFTCVVPMGTLTARS